jgi:hypothetical protein
MRYMAAPCVPTATERFPHATVVIGKPLGCIYDLASMILPQVMIINSRHSKIMGYGKDCKNGGHPAKQLLLTGVVGVVLLKNRVC